jgi:hypothetical protein
MTTSTKPAVGQSILVVLAAPRTLNGIPCRHFDGIYAPPGLPATHPTPWRTSIGDLRDADVSGWVSTNSLRITPYAAEGTTGFVT